MKSGFSSNTATVFSCQTGGSWLVLLTVLHVNDFVTDVINMINTNVNKPPAFVLIVARGR